MKPSPAAPQQRRWRGGLTGAEPRLRLRRLQRRALRAGRPGAARRWRTSAMGMTAAGAAATGGLDDSSVGGRRATPAATSPPSAGDRGALSGAAKRPRTTEAGRRRIGERRRAVGFGDRDKLCDHKSLRCSRHEELRSSCVRTKNLLPAGRTRCTYSQVCGHKRRRDVDPVNEQTSVNESARLAAAKEDVKNTEEPGRRLLTTARALSIASGGREVGVSGAGDAACKASPSLSLSPRKCAPMRRIREKEDEGTVSRSEMIKGLEAF
eukprot:281531-Chlamydomonas_euryale.AAC.2